MLLVQRAGVVGIVVGIVVIARPVDVPSLNAMEEDIQLYGVVKILM
jgi:hypothetical protein